MKIKIKKTGQIISASPVGDGYYIDAEDNVYRADDVEPREQEQEQGGQVKQDISVVVLSGEADKIMYTLDTIKELMMLGVDALEKALRNKNKTDD